MKFFPSFSFHKTQTVVLIDIGSASVSGAYARIDKTHNPILYYTARVPIRMRAKASADDMERALAELTKTLILRGAPALARAVGKGNIDRILISIAAPWQETHTLPKRINNPAGFRFTRRMMDAMVKKITVPPPGRTQTNKMVVATLLNGYEITDPFGKSAHSAEVIALSSSVTDEVARAVIATVRKTFHTDQIELTAFAPVAYVVLRDLFPKEDNFLVMDVTGEATDLALVRQGLLVEVESIPCGLNLLRLAAIEAGLDNRSPAKSLQTVDEVALIDMEHNSAFTSRMRSARDEWLNNLSKAFQALAVQYALPRMIFLLADEEALGFLKHVLNDESGLQKLWLSDQALPIFAIDPGQLAQHVMYRGTARGDTFLSLLALYTTHGYAASTTTRTK